MTSQHNLPVPHTETVTFYSYDTNFVSSDNPYDGTLYSIKRITVGIDASGYVYQIRSVGRKLNTPAFAALQTIALDEPLTAPYVRNARERWNSAHH